MGEMGGGREEAFLRLVRKEGIGPPSSRMGGGALVRSVSAGSLNSEGRQLGSGRVGAGSRG